MGSRRMRFGGGGQGGAADAPELPPRPDGTPPDDTPDTYGQKVPKQESKLRHDKEKSRHSDRLRHDDKPDGGGKPDPKADKKAAREGDKLDKSKLRMEKNSEKLDKAKDKLSAKKPPKKPGIVKKSVNTVRTQAWLIAHGKIYQAESENVGIKAAHRTELAGEATARGGYRFVKNRIRTAPARRVRKLEKQNIKLKADYSYRAMAKENPDLKKKALSKYLHKRRIKKLYQKQAREATKKGTAVAAKATKKSTLVTIAITRRIGRAILVFVKTNPKLALIILALIMLVVIINSCVSSAVTIGNSLGGAVGASTFPSEDSEMLAAEAAYSALEDALRYQLDNFEALNPGHDEYHYFLDEIWHDPYVLISILSAWHEGEWTLEEVQGTIAMLFDMQYTLTVTVIVEIRYRTECYDDSWTDDEGNSGGGTYCVEVPYEYYICHVTLDNFNLSHLPVYIMGEGGLSRYAVYMATLGNRPDLFPAYIYPYASVLRDYERYDIPPEALSDPVFAAMIAEAEKYLGFPYVWGGSNPNTSFDCSGFVSWVINNSGWNVGRLGAKALYNICTPVSPANARPGDLIFFWRTYNAPDPNAPTHVGIYVGNGMMIHCGNPISYTSVTTTYWQNHFYGYGRLP